MRRRPTSRRAPRRPTPVTATPSTRTTRTYFKTIWFWTTPQSDCLDGRTDVKCVPYSRVDQGVEQPEELPDAGAQREAPTVRRPSGPRPRRTHRPPPSDQGTDDRRHRSAAGRRVARRRLSSWLHRRPRARLVALLALPLLWLVVIYFAALFSLLSTAFFSVDEFTNAVVRTFTMSNFQDVFTDPAYAQATLRTVGIAASVTVLCIVLGLPMAFFMAKVAKPRSRGFLVALVDHAAVGVLPGEGLRVAGDGAAGDRRDRLDAASRSGCPGRASATVAVILTLTYLWLPYMILPIFAGLERLPDSLLDASGDLGARAGRTVPVGGDAARSTRRSIAGSIFTFSLSLGDYITVQIVGGRTQMLGNIVYQNYTANLPFAAAVAVIPVAIMVIYLALVRRTGALENL